MHDTRHEDSKVVNGEYHQCPLELKGGLRTDVPSLGTFWGGPSSNADESFRVGLEAGSGFDEVLNNRIGDSGTHGSKQEISSKLTTQNVHD